MSVHVSRSTVERTPVDYDIRIGSSKFRHRAVELAKISGDYYDTEWSIKTRCGLHSRDFSDRVTARRRACKKCYADASGVQTRAAGGGVGHE
jgi:hypothetical protein